MPTGFPTFLPDEVLERWQQGGPRSGWRRRAACLGEDPNVFHPASDRGDTATAKAICRGCPVRPDCLITAMLQERHDDHRQGIWGGATPDERERMWRKLSRAR